MAVKLNIIGWRHSSKAAFRWYIDNLVAAQAFAGANAKEDKEKASSKDKL
jgi:superfamily II DNA helicase RecQ